MKRFVAYYYTSENVDNMGINSSRPTQNTVAPAPTMNLMQHEIVDLGESVAITTGTLIPVDIIASVTGREPGILSLSQSPIRTARNRGSQAIEPAQPRQSCQLDTSDEEELELASTSAIRNALKSPNKVKEKLRNTNEVQMPGRAFEMTVVWCDDQVHDTHENIEMQKKLLEVSKSLTVQS